jgi:hypothetical protein
VLRDLLRSLLPRRRPAPPAPAGRPAGRPAGPSRHTAYAGDFAGRADLEYTPHPDDRPDPGEVVWAWVPFEENHRRGKDRPVLVVGRDGGLLLHPDAVRRIGAVLDRTRYDAVTREARRVLGW